MESVTKAAEFSSTILNAFKNMPISTVEPSAFEKHVAEQLHSLAEALLAGEWSVQHFSLTIDEGKQKVEITVA